MPLEYVRSQGKAKQMGAKLMAIVAEGERGRIYCAPTEEQEQIAAQAQPSWKPDGELPIKHRNFQTPAYGMPNIGDLFTNRQPIALTTFSDLVGEAREKLIHDAATEEYADAVATYLGLAVSRLSDICNSFCRWENTKTQVRNLFARQAIPMLWDYAEPNVFAEAAGDFSVSLGNLIKALEKTPSKGQGFANQIDVINLAQTVNFSLVSTDPPYYDSICYADLSDFFYAWLRCSLGKFYSELFSTLLVPKVQELVATPHRFDGNKQKAKDFFEEGLGKAFSQICKTANPDYPVTVYYAFKQAESEDVDENEINIGSVTASTGWETMLEGLIKAGFSITGTLPIRTELSNRPVASGSNALASSIVLVCRPRPAPAPQTTRRDFLNALKRELPSALKALQQGNIAPVDFAQACIGPGMAIYSRYASVLEADGAPMRVRTALQLINQSLDEFLAEQEGEFDADTRWALAWFEQHQFESAAYSIAETPSKAKNTSIQGLVEAGILEAKAGKVRLLKREELSQTWNPSTDTRIPDWEIAQQLIWALDRHGEQGAGILLSKVGDRGEIARDLAYRLYNLCDRKSWTQEAIAYNSLVIVWSEISRLALVYSDRSQFKET